MVRVVGSVALSSLGTEQKRNSGIQLGTLWGARVHGVHDKMTTHLCAHISVARDIS